LRAHEPFGQVIFLWNHLGLVFYMLWVSCLSYTIPFLFILIEIIGYYHYDVYDDKAK